MARKEQHSVYILGSDGRYRVDQVRRSEEVPSLLQAKQRAYVDDLVHPTVFSQYNRPWVADPDDGIYGRVVHMERPDWRRWSPKYRAITLEGHASLLSTDTTTRDAKQNTDDVKQLAAAQTQAEQRRLKSATQQRALSKTLERERNSVRNARITTWLTLAVLALVMIVALIFLPSIIGGIGDSLGAVSLFGGGEEIATGGPDAQSN